MNPEKAINHGDFAAIVLAAGTSARMGQSKCSLPWIDGKKLLEWIVEALIAGGWSPTVVLGPHNYQRWEGHLPGAATALNPNAAEGKTTSLEIGAGSLIETPRAILITSVDEPRGPDLYARLKCEAVERPGSIIVPDDAGHRGHPVVLPGNLRDDLLNLNEEAHGLRGLLDNHHKITWRMPCESPQWHFNTPEAYAEALEWFRRQISSGDQKISHKGTKPRRDW